MGTERRVDHLVLGGGITGLATAYRLHQKGENVHLLEGSSRLGGWCETLSRNGLLIERGPRTFSTSRSTTLLRLIDELGMASEVRVAPPSVKKRYLWDGTRMVEFPPRPSDWLLHPLLRKVARECIKEPWSNPPPMEAESLGAFVRRRLGSASYRLLTPLVQGIWAADPDRMDAASTLSTLVKAEKESGSLLQYALQGLLRARASNGQEHRLPRGSLWSLQEGVGSLIHRLEALLSAFCTLKTRIEGIEQEEEGWAVHCLCPSGEQVWRAEHLWVTLPLTVLHQVRAPWKAALPQWAFQTLECLSLTWQGEGRLPDGFGYLCLTPTEEPLLGAVYDSSCAPHLTPGASQATLMRGGALQKLSGQRDGRSVLQSIQRFCEQVGVVRPDRVLISRADQAIPNYPVGAQQSIQRFSDTLKGMPPVHFLGASWGGVSVEDCVRTAFSATREAGGYAPSVALPGYIPST